jgi:hypothetical protein
MTPELIEEYSGNEDREATISIVSEKLSMWRYSYEILLAKDGKIVGKHVTDLLDYARLIANRWITKGELTDGTK